MTVTLETTTGPANLLEREDYATTAFACNNDALLEPVVVIAADSGLLGNGTTPDALAVQISAQSGNAISINPDSDLNPGLYVQEACTQILAETPQALPAFLVGYDTGLCPSRLNVSANAVLFGDPANSKKVHEDALNFKYEPSLNSLVVGSNLAFSGLNAFASGDNNAITGLNSIASGFGNTASGINSHAFGAGCTASGLSAFAGGTTCVVSGDNSSSSGENNTADGVDVLVSGFGNVAHGACSVASGSGCTSDGTNSHVFGSSCEANFDGTYAGGNTAIADNLDAFAHGVSVTASGIISGAFGIGTTAQGYCQVTQGSYNVPSGTAGSLVFSDFMHIWGNGDSITPSNAFALRYDGITQWTSPVTTQADNTAAIAALAALTLTNLAIGALAFVDVAGVPSWFKYNGTVWTFAF